MNVELIDLSGKKALVTGGRSGVCWAIAIELAHAGVECAILGRDQSRLDDTAKTCADAGHLARPVVCDLDAPNAGTGIDP